MKKGFTLIELLAVIVILAIIALIAVPIVINIINDAKNSSEKGTVELYIDTVKKSIVRKQLTDPAFNPSKCDIKDNGNLLCDNNTEVIIDMKGKMPIRGDVIIKNNKINIWNILYNGKIYYPNYARLIDDADNNGEVSIGDKYEYKVNDTDTFYFYVLSLNDNNTVNLIMDRNICEDGTTNYSSDSRGNKCMRYWGGSMNSSGPIAAMTALGNGTRNWNNVPNMNAFYDDKKENEDFRGQWEYGYTSLEIIDGIGTITTKTGEKISINLEDNKPLKTRLPKLSEVMSDDVGCVFLKSSDNYGSCPIWLVETLQYAQVKNDKYSINKQYDWTNDSSLSPVYHIKGYWLLSSFGDHNKSAMIIDNYGAVSGGETSYDSFGLRPVITIPISYLEE